MTNDAQQIEIALHAEQALNRALKEAIRKLHCENIALQKEVDRLNQLLSGR